MPIDYKRYPKHWEELRKQVLERAKNKCEFCGVKNYAHGYRTSNGEFMYCSSPGIKTFTIVLTIAHLDHDEENENVTIDRLAALCQRCHLRYDVEEKKRRRKNKKAIDRLFNQTDKGVPE